MRIPAVRLSSDLCIGLHHTSVLRLVRPSFSNETGTESLAKDEVCLPGDDWYWTNDWEIVVGPDYDPQGWRYADSFTALGTPGGGSYVFRAMMLS
jgi:hypothetical protein